jgi:hypothetical protein
MKKYIIWGLLLLMCASTPGQEPDGAFGIDLGYLVTIGDWNSLRLNKNVKLFNSNVSYGAELEFKLWNVPTAIFINYAKLSTSEYEDYIKNQGEYVTASASMMNLGFLLKYYALKHPKQLLNVDLGIGYISFNGRETSELFSYDYEFINDKANFTIIIGLGYKYKVEQNIAVSLSARMVINPGGIQYADGKGYDVVVLPICLGLRYLF